MRPAAACGFSSTVTVVNGGEGTPARASRPRITSLLRVAWAAASGFTRRPRASPIAEATTVVASSTGTTASSGRRAAYPLISRAAAAGSPNGRVSRWSGNSPAITFGRSEAITRSTSSVCAASTKSSVR